MNVSSAKMDQLNSLIGKVLNCWMAIVEFDVEVQYCFESEDADPATDKVVGYEVFSDFLPDFGDLIISDDGNIEEQVDHELKECFMVITAPIEVNFPKPLHDSG